jgi:hypothetical protein
MSELSVKVHSPAGTDVKVFLNGTEGTEIETGGQPVSVRIEQQPLPCGLSRKEKLGVYYASVFRKRLRYGTDIPTPFRARFTGTVRAGEEGTLGFSLACMEGHYRILPDRDCFVPGSVRSQEVNEDSGLWKLVLGTVLLPLLIILFLAVWALFRSEAPTVAKSAFGILYGVLIIGAVGMFLERTRRTRSYPTGAEQNE